jgi:hypothetical protein
MAEIAEVVPDGDEYLCKLAGRLDDSIRHLETDPFCTSVIEPFSMNNVFFFFLYKKADHKKFNQQYRSQYDVYSKAMSLVKKHSKKSSSKVNRSSASYDKEIKVNQITVTRLDENCLVKKPIIANTSLKSPGAVPRSHFRRFAAFL